jgi:hypothetical protein
MSGLNCSFDALRRGWSQLSLRTYDSSTSASSAAQASLSREDWMEALRDLMGQAEESDAVPEPLPAIAESQPLSQMSEMESKPMEALSHMNATRFLKRVLVRAYSVRTRVTALPGDHLVAEADGEVYAVPAAAFEKDYVRAHGTRGASRGVDVKRSTAVLFMALWRAFVMIPRVMCAGDANTYHEVVPILARLMARPFSAKNSAGDQYGPAGSFLVQVHADPTGMPAQVQLRESARLICAFALLASQAPDGEQYAVEPGVFVESYERDVRRTRRVSSRPVPMNRAYNASGMNELAQLQVGAVTPRVPIWTSRCMGAT